jgi:hypothetical protein
MEVHPINILGKDTTFEMYLGGKENTVPAKCNFILYWVLNLKVDR